MQPTLYLMVGYPGAGKTTISRMIRDATGAEHLWADHERRQRYNPPTYSQTENAELYKDLNSQTDRLLSEGKSVIFDTNFNFLRDRELLRKIAGKHNAKTVVVWVHTDKEVAKQRATADAHSQDSRLLGNMPIEKFEHLSSELEPPLANENVVEIDGVNTTAEQISSLLLKK